MPPRKSNASVASATEEGTPTAPRSRRETEDGMSVEDLSLPRTVVQRLSKGMLPPNTIIHKDAILALSKSATVFVNYLTDRSHEFATASNKKTIQPSNVMDALKELELESFVPRCEQELAKYIEVNTMKRNDYRKKVKQRDSGVQGQEAPAEGAAEGENAQMESNGPEAIPRQEGGEPPAAKKARMEGGGEDDEMEDEPVPADDVVDEPEEDDEDEEVQDEDEAGEDEDAAAESQLREDPVEIQDDAGEDEEGDESD